MSSPSHAASRATTRTHLMVLRVSQPALDRRCVRSLRRQRACTDCRTTSDRLLPPGTRASLSRLGDDLVCFVARTCLTNYVEHHGLTLIEFSASGPGPKHNERNHR
jgi:hypothetical protein